MKIALVCSGVGQVQRGFERLMLDIFGILRDSCDVTLFKGGGPAAEREKAVWNIPRHGRVNRLLTPVHRLTNRSAYHVECWSFALALMPHLIRGRYDIVHFIDLPMGRILHHGRRFLRRPYRLLFTIGAVMDLNVRYYPPADHYHQIASLLHEAGLRGGVPADRMSLLPCGIHPERFATPETRAALRARYGVPPERFVILSVCAINRTQKRVDHVIDDVSRLGPEFFLWLDGNPEDPSVLRLAESRLPGRFRVSHVPSSQVGELYRMADLFVLGSVEESFGLAVVEAMMCGLPVVTHDGAHFQWLVGERECLIDMTQPGLLGRRIAELAAQPARLRRLAEQNAHRALHRFSWAGLKTGYIDMYRRVAAQASS